MYSWKIKGGSKYYWASLVAQLVKNLLVMQGPWIDSWVGKICWRRVRLPTAVFLGFPGGSAVKEFACNVGHLSLTPGLGRSPGGGNSLPTPVSWPGEFHELYSSWGCKEPDTTE